MSRSNGPLGQSGGAQPPYKRTVADQDPADRAQYSLGHAPAPGQQPRHSPAAFGNLDQGHNQGYPTAGQTYGQANPPAHHLGPGAYPNQPAFQHDQGYYPPAAQPSAGQASYQPVFDRYAPPPQEAPARAVDPALRGYDIRAQAPRAAPTQAHQAPAPAYNPQDAYRGAAYDQWQQQAANPQQSFAPPAAAVPGSNGYDFSNYMPAAAPPQDYGRQDYGVNPQFGQHAPQQSQRPGPGSPAGRGGVPADNADWQLNGTHDRRNEHPAEPQGYRDQHEFAAEPQPYGDDSAGQLQHADDLAYDQDDLPDYEDDEPRKGRRGLIMVSALVGAIALGGSMAYAYKTFIKPSAGGQVAKVSAPKGPTKTAPADPGGKQFPNQESKLQERLGDGTASPSGMAPAGGASNVGDTDGVQRVRTMTVGRDGTLSAPVQAASAIPGMVVQMPAPAQPAPAPAPVQQTAQAAPVAQPRAVVPQARTVVAAVSEVAPPEASAPAPTKRAAAAQKKSLAVRDDLVASNGVPSAATVAPLVSVKAGGSGFVAVIASKASKADAQKANADLEQRFDVLKGKIFDVQEADLTAQGKGVVYRSVVGPPGSRAFASGICEQLKSVGYADCWPVKYN